MLMPHGRTQSELEVDRNGRKKRQPQNSSRLNRSIPGVQSMPEISRDQGDKNDEAKKCLRQTRVKNTDLVFQHGDTKTSEDALQNNAQDGVKSQLPDPAAFVRAPKPDGKNDG